MLPEHPATEEGFWAPAQEVNPTCTTQSERQRPRELHRASRHHQSSRFKPDSTRPSLFDAHADHGRRRMSRSIALATSPSNRTHHRERAKSQLVRAETQQDGREKGYVTCPQGFKASHNRSGAWYFAGATYLKSRNHVGVADRSLGLLGSDGGQNEP